MANMSNNNNFSDAELDMARIYGVNDLAGGSERNLENLAGYNVNEAENNTHGDNSANVENNSAEAGKVVSSGATDHDVLEGRNNVAEQIEHRDHQMIPAPHRQEQTLPTTRVDQGVENNNEANTSLALENLHEVSGKNMDAFLHTQIGKDVRIQFLIGTDTLIEKSGVLLAVGNNFVVLREPESGETVVCDFGGAKFINFEGTEVMAK